MSLVTAKALREKRATLAKQAQDLVEKANTESRTMTAEEAASFDAFHVEIEEIRGQYERIEKQETVMAELNASLGRLAGGREQPGAGTEDRAAHPVTTGRPIALGEPVRSEALRGWLLRGSTEIPDASMQNAARQCGVDLSSKLMNFALPHRELRGLDRDSVKEWTDRYVEARAQSTSGSAGGYTIPDEAMRELEIALLRFGGMRQVASVVRTATGAPLPWPTTNDTSNKGEIIGENGAVNAQDVSFGQLTLDAFKYSSKLILVSVELLQDSSVNVAEVIGRMLGERIGRITNDHFTTGTGISQPNGIVTASTLGKAGSSGTATSFIIDDIVDLVHSVDPDYRSNARFMFADASLKALKKLKAAQFSGDTAGVPLWLPGLAVREPDTILGYPYVINQSMAVPANGAKSVLFGDFSKYKIRDVRDVTLLRLDERYAEYHQVAFLAFSRHDGDLLDAGTNPVKHLTNTT